MASPDASDESVKIEKMHISHRICLRWEAAISLNNVEYFKCDTQVLPQY